MCPCISLNQTVFLSAPRKKHFGCTIVEDRQISQSSGIIQILIINEKNAPSRKSGPQFSLVEVDAAALDRALQALAQRHAVLRTTYEEDGAGGADRGEEATAPQRHEGHGAAACPRPRPC